MFSSFRPGTSSCFKQAHTRKVLAAFQWKWSEKCCGWRREEDVQLSPQVLQQLWWQGGAVGPLQVGPRVQWRHHPEGSPRPPDPQWSSCCDGGGKEGRGLIRGALLFKWIKSSEHHTVLLCDISKLWHLYHYTIYQSNKIHLFFTFDDDVIFWDEGCQAERAPCSRYVIKCRFFSALIGAKNVQW